MAVFGLTSDATHLLMSGIDTWKISNTAANNGFVSLGLLKDGKISVKGLGETDTRKRNHTYGFMLEATAKMLYTDKAVCLELLSAVSASGPLHQKITLVNGSTIKGQWGFNWNFVSDKEFDGVRYIEVKATIGQVLATNLDALFSAPGVDGTPTGTLATFAPATMYPGGISTLQIKKVGETAETVGLTRDVVFKIGSKELKKDSLGRQYCVGVEFSLEFDMLQTNTAELNLLDSISTSTEGFIVTLADGTVFTLTGATTGSGVEWEYKHDNDSDELAVIHVKGTGVLTLAEYDTAIS
jgi:hypothetical protein